MFVLLHFHIFFHNIINFEFEVILLLTSIIVAPFTLQFFVFVQNTLCKFLKNFLNTSIIQSLSIPTFDLMHMLYKIMQVKTTHDLKSNVETISFKMIFKIHKRVFEEWMKIWM